MSGHANERIAEHELPLRSALAAGVAARDLAELRTDDPRLMDVTVDGVRLQVPNVAVAVLRDALVELSLGRSITIAPTDLRIGTVEAARLLGVSRPWIAQMIDKGELPGSLSGSKRRIQLGDLVQVSRERQARLALARATAFDSWDEDGLDVADDTAEPRGDNFVLPDARNEHVERKTESRPPDGHQSPKADRNVALAA